MSSVEIIADTYDKSVDEFLPRKSTFRDKQSLLLNIILQYLPPFKTKTDSKHLNQQGGFHKGYFEGRYFCYSLQRSR